VLIAVNIKGLRPEGLRPKNDGRLTEGSCLIPLCIVLSPPKSFTQTCKCPNSGIRCPLVRISSSTILLASALFIPTCRAQRGKRQPGSGSTGIHAGSGTCVSCPCCSFWARPCMSDVHLSMLCVLGKTMFVFKGSGKTCAAWVHNVLVDRRTRAAQVHNGLAIEELVQHGCTMCW